MPAPYTAETNADDIVKDLPSEIKDRVILVTGVTPGGLGAAFAEAIAKAQPSLLIFAGRTPSKIKSTIDAITGAAPNVQTRALPLNLDTLQGARDAAAVVNNWADIPHIDTLVNNAGIMACAYEKSKDGPYEKQFAVNHMGPWLFTNLVMEKILASKNPRVVTVASDGHRLSQIRWPDLGFDEGRLYSKWKGYGQSKTANCLMTVALADKLGKKGLTAISLHPGVIGTNLGNHIDWSKDYAEMQAIDKDVGNVEGWSEAFDFKTLQQGVATHVYAAFEPSLKDHNGAYCQDAHIADPTVDTIKSYATSNIDAERLWRLSEKLAGQTFEY